MQLTDIKGAVAAAVAKLFDEDYALLDFDANERSITHKLAEHLAAVGEFPKPLEVDCEYNRHELDKKFVEYPKQVSSDDTTGRSVYPDIIVHVRGIKKNLLVIEVKRSTNVQSRKNDFDKLRDLATDKRYSYAFGLFLEISTGSDIKGTLWADVIWFCNGVTDGQIERLAERKHVRTTPGADLDG
jgi:hypothetical protein